MGRDLRKVHDSGDEIRFAHPHAGGWVTAVIGAGMIGVGFAMLEGGGLWALSAFGALFVLGGVSAALHREELAFDLTRGRYTWCRGRVGAVETGGGGFDDVEAVVLVKDLERRGSDKVDEWEVELVLRGWARPIEVLETKDEQTARREAERLADRLGAQLRERTST